MPTFIAATWRDALGLGVSPVPIDLPTYAVEASWTAANDGDAGLQWLIAELQASVATRGPSMRKRIIL